MYTPRDEAIAYPDTMAETAEREFPNSWENGDE
jgi:hypothetical protein